jgi:uncharacterized protein YcnI
MYRKIIAGLTLLTGILFSAVPAFAHVVVKPSSVGVGERVSFVVSVPTEEDVPTVGLRLVIPSGLKSVRPNVKPGWTIKLTKSSEGEEATVTEISWTGGNIPADQRDDFTFAAQAPAAETTLIWKAYQTYADGRVVAWEADPKVAHPSGHDESVSKSTPYSETKVVNDLKTSSVGSSNQGEIRDIKDNNSSFLISIIALIISLVSIGLQLRKKS